MDDGLAIDRGRAAPAAAVGLLALASGGGIRGAAHLERIGGSETAAFGAVIMVLTLAAIGAGLWARPPIHRQLVFFLPWIGASAVAVLMATVALMTPESRPTLGPAALETAGGLGLLSAVARAIEATLVERFRWYHVGGQAKAELHHDAMTSSLVPASALVAGDEIRVSAGDRIPVDGRLSSPGGEVDESAVMGDGPTVDKVRRDPVFAGTRAGSPLRVEVAGPWAESWAAQRDARHDEVVRRLTEPDPSSRATAAAATVIAAAVAGWAITRSGPLAVGEWMPTVAAVLMATVVMSDSLARMRARLGFLQGMASAGLVISRPRDLRALASGGRWFIDPTLIVVPGALEVRPVGGFRGEDLLAVAEALMRTDRGLLPAALRGAPLTGRRNVDATPQGRSGVYRGTIDGDRWFVGPSDAVEDQLDRQVVADARAAMPELGDLDPCLWWIGRDERTLAGAIAISIDVEASALAAGRALEARLSPLEPDATMLSALTGVPVADRPPGPRDVTIVDEQTPPPRAGVRIRVVDPRIGRRLPVAGAPRLMRPALARWAEGFAGAADDRAKALGHGWLVLATNMTAMAALALTGGLAPWVAAGLGLLTLLLSAGRPPLPPNFSGRW